jgi:Ca2+-binding EF-hand superfamily protein
MLRVLSASVLALLIDASIGVAYAQSRNETSGPAAGGDDLIVSTAGLWGGSLGVYSCDQWRRYVTDLFDRADRYHRGYIDEKQFKIIKYASPIFAKAEFGYFDENGDGRITKAAFVDKPSEFFLRFDKRHDCRVTPDEMNQASPAAQEKPKMGRRGGAGGF